DLDSEIKVSKDQGRALNILREDQRVCSESLEGSEKRAKSLEADHAQLQGELEKLKDYKTPRLLDVVALQGELDKAREENAQLKARQDADEAELGTLQADLVLAQAENVELKKGEAELEKARGEVAKLQKAEAELDKARKEMGMLQKGKEVAENAKTELQKAKDTS
ncbi:unnamed protein product, partial [Polarella glacialis]